MRPTGAPRRDTPGHLRTAAHLGPLQGTGRATKGPYMGPTGAPTWYQLGAPRGDTPGPEEAAHLGPLHGTRPATWGPYMGPTGAPRGDTPAHLGPLDGTRLPSQVRPTIVFRCSGSGAIIHFPIYSCYIICFMYIIVLVALVAVEVKIFSVALSIQLIELCCSYNHIHIFLTVLLS